MKYLTLKEVSQDYGIPYSTLYVRMRKSDVAARKTFGVWEVPEDSITTLCHQGSRVTHGETKTKLYRRWSSLKYLSKEEWPEEWDDYLSFKATVGEPPGPSSRLTRVLPHLPWGRNNFKWTNPDDK